MQGVSPVLGELSGRVALVTGGASGIGLGVVEAFVEAGAAVAIADRDESALEEVRERFASGAARIVARTVDVTRAEEMASFVGDTIERLGRIDTVVTAAGIQEYGDVETTSLADWRRVLDINLTGAFVAISAALPSLRQAPGSSIVLVSSVQSVATQTNVAAYSVSKGALNALARSLAVDEARFGIRANAVLPGSVDTPMLRASARRFSDGTYAGEQALLDRWGRSHPLGRVGRPAEIAETVVFLASDRASFITGAAIPVDGGLLAGLSATLPE